MRLRLALALSLLATPSYPEVQVSVRDGRVAIRATGAPLAEVLKSFAEATGTEVVYEAARPRQLVTVAIEAGSAAEALARLLEGQGLNYLLRLDPSGKTPEMLFVAGSASPTPAPAGAARGPRATPPAFRPPEEEVPEEPAAEIEPPPPEEAEGVEPSAPPGYAVPAPGTPWPGAAPGVPPGQEPSGPETPPGSTTPQPGQPQPPAPASYPGGAPAGPPAPQPPVPPGPASYP